jgi:hypothetical protein
VDVAPTLAALLGANIPASSQGHVRTEMLALTSKQRSSLQAATLAQQARLAEAYGAAIGRSVAVKPGDDVVTVTQAALDEARSNRLNAERWPRVVVALIVALVPAIVLFKKRGQAAAWLLIGAVLYLVMFNARYAVIDGRTYSLSSVIDATDVILYCAITALIALGLSWLIVSIGLGAFKRGARAASETTLALTLTVVYLLTLPVLAHFALNGALVTWALPDFLSAFLAFLSLTQMLMVAALGLVFTVVAALIASFIAKSVPQQG